MQFAEQLKQSQESNIIEIAGKTLSLTNIQTLSIRKFPNPDYIYIIVSHKDGKTTELKFSSTRRFTIGRSDDELNQQHYELEARVTEAFKQLKKEWERVEKDITKEIIEKAAKIISEKNSKVIE